MASLVTAVPLAYDDEPNTESSYGDEPILRYICLCICMNIRMYICTYMYENCCVFSL
jgi:hypothetical protein